MLKRSSSGGCGEGVVGGRRGFENVTVRTRKGPGIGGKWPDESRQMDWLKMMDIYSQIYIILLGVDAG